ncbi:MAG: PAS-domain containing protein [Desulfosarcinaceae bacterium]
MRGLKKQTLRNIYSVVLLTLGLGLASWYGLHRTQKTVADFEAVNLPEMSTALNLSEGVAQLAAQAPYIAGSAKPFQLQTERDRLEARFKDLKQIAQHLKNRTFKRDLETRLDKFRQSLSELIRRIEEELFYREDLLVARFELTELQRRDLPALSAETFSAVDLFTLLGFLVDPSASGLSVQRRLLGDALDQLAAGPKSPDFIQAARQVIDKIIQTREREETIGRRKAYLLASLRAQSEQLAEQVTIFTQQLERDVVRQRKRVQSTVFNAYAGMMVIAGLLIWGMLHHYRFNYRMTRDLSLVTQDMLRLAEKGDADTCHIGIQREDEIGELARAFTIFCDYAFQIKAFSDRLAQQKVLLETVFNQINDGLSVYSAEGRLLSWNKRFLEIFNFSTDQVFAGRDLSDLQAEIRKAPHEFRAMDHTPVDIERLNALRYERPLIFEHRYHDGRVVEFRSQPMPGGGFVTLYTDLTERRAFEAQLHQAQKMEVLGQLTGGVAHDFNNLLAALLANLQLLDATPELSVKQRRYVRRSIRVAEKGVNLIERLLAFSRKQQLHPESLDINDLIMGMLDLVEYSMAPGITLHTDLEADAPVFVDPSQLEHAILNLAVNSSAAMPDGGRLSFRTRKQRPSGSHTDCIALVVEDTGVGIPRNMQTRVLEPFFTTKPTGQGSGMGLSMVYGFVNQSGGEMWLESNPGRGTRITLLFPIEASGSRTAQKRRRRPTVEPALIPEGKTVLLVEDNASVREAVSEQVASFGNRVTSAPNAEAALELLEAQAADVALVITDISLSGPLSGVDLKQQLARRYPGIGVVLTSGLPRENLEQHYGLTPDDDVISKPIPLPTLRQLLGR